MLGRAFEEVRAYSLLPAASTGGHYKASSAPSISKQADFFELVKWDSEMDESTKAYWLSQTPIDKEL